LVSLSASALITAGAITALGLGLVTNSPAVLTLSGPLHSTATPFGLSVATTQQSTKFSFVATKSIAHRAEKPTTLSYQLVFAPNPEVEARRIGEAFKITGVPVKLPGEGWSIRSHFGTVVDYIDGAIPHWYYSSRASTITSATQRDTAPAPLVTRSTIARVVERLLSRLGFDYHVVSPMYSKSTIYENTAGPSRGFVREERTNFVIAINGIRTNQSLSVTLNRRGRILFASGPAFGIREGTSYPLLSLRNGIRALNARTTSLNHLTVSNPPVTPTSTRSSAHVKFNVVTIDSSSLLLEPFQLTNGSLWLLPTYHFTGTVHTGSGSRTVSLSELAITPRFIHGDPKS
jgi:hypothetical protein